MQHTLVLMAKAPRLGQVKTRLARSIGATEASRFYRTMSIAVIRRLWADPRWTTIVAVAPEQFRDSRFWPARLPRMGQRRGDLGLRMQHVFESLQPGPVLISGTDIPGISPFHIDCAFRKLGGNDVVFGPAGDGGYWLVGCKHAANAAAMFANVRWSTAHALADSIANVSHLKVGLADTLEDVDDRADYLRWRITAGRLIGGQKS